MNDKELDEIKKGLREILDAHNFEMYIAGTHLEEDGSVNNNRLIALISTLLILLLFISCCCLVYEVVYELLDRKLI